MTMPEAPVYEDHRAMPWHYDVGTTRKVPATEAIAQSMDQASNKPLRARVGAFDAGHALRARYGTQRVSHSVTKP
jgi:hypothetical protein